MVPGKEHVDLREVLKDWPAEKVDPVIMPDELEPARSAQICGQCHGITLFEDRSYENDYFTKGETFKPGTDLTDVDRVIWNERDDPYHPIAMREKAAAKSTTKFFWSDGMVRVSGREYNGLLNSPCFAHEDTEKQMTCLSCHVLHQPKGDPRPVKEWANDQLRIDRQGNDACVQCHEGFGSAKQLVAHTHHAAESSGSQCYNCHMPHTTYGLLKGIRSHTVSSPSVQETLVTGRPNACNHCHLDRSLGWAADHLSSHYGQQKPALSPVQRGVPASLIALYQGDAGQRALAAWAMGWSDARGVSTTDWMPAALIDLLDDPYDAVRYIAQRSLRLDSRFADWTYDFTDAPATRQKNAVKAMALWQEKPGQSLFDLLGADVSTNVFYELRADRDERPVHLLE